MMGQPLGVIQRELSMVMENVFIGERVELVAGYSRPQV